MKKFSGYFLKSTANSPQSHESFISTKVSLHLQVLSCGSGRPAEFLRGSTNDPPHPIFLLLPVLPDSVCRIYRYQILVTRPSKTVSAESRGKL
jgi:hypothetical protein